MKISNLKKKALSNCEEKWMSLVGITLMYLVLSGLGVYLVELLFLNLKETIITTLLNFIVKVFIQYIIIKLFYIKYLINFRNSENTARYRDVRLTFHMIFNNIKYILVLCALSILPVIIILLFSFFCILYLRGILYYFAIINGISRNTIDSAFMIVQVLTLLSCIFIIWIRITYIFTIYIIAENKEKTTVLKAMREARRLIKGHKCRFILLQISFIGWILLSICSLGIGSLWLMPYIELTNIEFLYELRAIKNK